MRKSAFILAMTKRLCQRSTRQVRDDRHRKNEVFEDLTDEMKGIFRFKTSFDYGVN